MTYQSSANDLLVISKYLVDTNATGGKYTTIQEAITAAVADGAASATPLDVIIKPGTYTEDLTLADGVNLIAFEFSSSNPIGLTQIIPTSSVIIDGEHSLSSGLVNIYGIKFTQTNSNVFSFTGGTVNFGFCISELTNSVLFNLSAANNKNLLMDNCYWEGDATSKFITHTATANNLSIKANNIVVYGMQTLNDIGITGTIDVVFKSSLLDIISFDCSSISGGEWSYYFCRCGDNATDEHITITDVNLRFFNCVFSCNNSSYFIDMSGSSTGNLIISNCSAITNSTTLFTWNISSTTTIEIMDYLQEGYGTIYSQRIFGGVRDGYKNTELIEEQRYVQTTDATVTTIWSYTLSTNQGVTIEAMISGKKSDSSASIGGNIVGVARRAGAGAILVGAPVTNVLEDSAGAPTFTIDVNGNDVRLRITGIAAETWNWVAYVKYQKIETNS